MGPILGLKRRGIMRREQIYDLTLTAMFLAIILVMAFVPYLGFIPSPFIPGVSLTLIHIPVIIGGIILGRKKSWLLGTFFGLMSLVLSFLRPQGPVDKIFHNPLVSVLPRIIFGIVIFEIYNLLSKLIKVKAVNVAITMVVSSLIHTLLVIVMLYLFGKDTLVSLKIVPENVAGNVIKVIGIFMLMSGLIEAGLALLIGTPTTTTLLVYSENR